MSYRFHPVIPTDFRPSMPEGPHEDHVIGRLNSRYEANHRYDKSPYSRSTMAYTICTIAASALFIAAGVPLLAMGEEMAWWTWATFPIGGGIMGLLVLIWSGGKDEESRRKTKWTSIFGLVGAVAVPRVWLHLHPSITESAFMRDPLVLGGMGFVLFLTFSALSIGYMKWREKDAPNIGYREAQKASKRYIETPTEKLEK